MNDILGKWGMAKTSEDMARTSEEMQVTLQETVNDWKDWKETLQNVKE